MNDIYHTYKSLLADVADLTGYSEIRGSCEGLQWCLYEAPRLEKLVLNCIEFGRLPNLKAFPASLRRLVAGSLVDPVQLRYLRQLLLFCYKAYVTHEAQTTTQAFENFEACNRSVGEFGHSLSQRSPLLLNRVRKLCHSVLYAMRPKEIIPSHGPGAVTTSKEKWLHRYSTIEYLYPQSDWYALYFNRDACADLAESVDEPHITARLIAVPKDTRGPRLICVHPAESIWIQQGLRRELERAIRSRRRHRGPWPCGHIHFDDQSVNGRIALLSSRSRRYATIDMKEASDRISEPLVQTLFGRYYKWFGCCRAQKYVTSDRSNPKDLHCYAPMGNATTFPVQSLIFWAICVASLQHHGCKTPGAVYVFGDDIIVPSRYAQVVMNDLESFGLVVNQEKSFFRGHFRESCGIDALGGCNVSPIRWKSRFDVSSAEDLQSLSDLAMRLRMCGYEGAAVHAYSILRQQLHQAPYRRRLFRTRDSFHGGIAEFVFREEDMWADAYWHRPTQQYVTTVWRLERPPQKRGLHGWNHVLESVCSLERTGASNVPSRLVSRRVRLVRGWTPAVPPFRGGQQVISRKQG